MNYITEPPSEHVLEYPPTDTLTYAEQMNCLRITRLMDNDTVTAYLDRNVIQDIGQVSSIIPYLCRAYAERFPERHLKAFIYIDKDIDYSIPSISGVKYCHHIRSGKETPVITYLSPSMMHNMLKALGRVMTERFWTVIILINTPSSALETSRVEAIFSRRDRTFVYEEITF
ncbi:hypothetical protein PENTCL1PPCAC_18580 [Pristionchus entomophagus]|uniref:CRAL-TRIO domain containing protein n=1 Tax=Pristionchus entomophagus TaxID=358040 RepID=A0AAV5TQ37_9BILA|nr:hypothetical protein PENTCL1PPCAC_18580 [Pristionchus entomophagus]